MYEIKTWLCFQITTACIILGWLNVAVGIVLIIQSIASWFGISDPPINYYPTDSVYKISFQIIWLTVLIVSGCFLVLSVKMRRSSFTIPWLIYNGMIMISGCIAIPDIFVMVLSMDIFSGIVFIYMAACVVGMWFYNFNAVYSLQCELMKNNLPQAC